MPNAIVNRAFILDVGRAAAVNVLLGATIFVILMSASALWSGAGALGFGAWFWIACLAAPANASILLPGAALVAVVSTMRCWMREGSWTGLNSLGIGGRGLVSALVGVALAVVALTALSTLVLEPASRRSSRAILAQAVGDVTLTPGVPTQVGELSVSVRPAQDNGAQAAFFAADGVIGFAQDVSISTVNQEAWVSMSDGTLIFDTEPQVRIGFSQWTRPLSLPRNRRLELDERTTPELLEVVTRTEHLGSSSAYEWSVLFKRFAHPLAMFPLLFAGLPLGRSSRVGVNLGLLGLGYLLSVRIGDALAPSLGPALSASAGFIYALIFAVVLWAKWRER